MFDDITRSLFFVSDLSGFAK